MKTRDCPETVSGLIIVLVMLLSCNKLIEIDPPDNSITNSKTFGDSANIGAAIAGIYANQMKPQLEISNGRITQVCGLYSDELNGIFEPTNDLYQIAASNGLPTNTVFDELWTQAYFCIYLANSILEGLPSSSGITKSLQEQFIGEVLFLRAFTYFNLVNIFGEIPLIRTSDWKSNQNVPKSSVEDILQFIVEDLKRSKSLTTYGYTISMGERTRVTSWAATALLARVYLYQGRWSEADSESKEVIQQSSMFELNNNLNDIFLKNNVEAILQWHINSETSPLKNLTPEGNLLIPNPLFGSPTYSLSSELLNEFESGDHRKDAWVESVSYADSTYYFPYKYKNGSLQYGGPTTEYYMVLRLAEQYLIRAEANAHMGKIEEATFYLNRIRERAKLELVPQGTSPGQLLNLILKERRIELAFEWGHRLFDIKRTGVIDSVLAKVKPQWKSFRRDFPIPLFEIQRNPSLIQNQGY